jgi:hypothetical protein
MRIGLWILPFRALRALVARWAHPGDAVAGRRPSPERIAWAVAAAGRRVPGSTCLTEALAAQILLARRGYPAFVRIGVARDGDDGIKAHAWVESEGKVLFNDPERSHFQPLPAWTEDAK